MNNPLRMFTTLAMSFIAAICIVAVLAEKDPAFQIHPTTWAGQPAFGQVNRDGSYTFYRVRFEGGQEAPGYPFITLPSGEAVKLH